MLEREAGAIEHGHQEGGFRGSVDSLFDAMEATQDTEMPCNELVEKPDEEEADRGGNFPKQRSHMI